MLLTDIDWLDLNKLALCAGVRVHANFRIRNTLPLEPIDFDIWALASLIGIWIVCEVDLTDVVGAIDDCLFGLWRKKKQVSNVEFDALETMDLESAHRHIIHGVRAWHNVQSKNEALRRLYYHESA